MTYPLTQTTISKLIFIPARTDQLQYSKRKKQIILKITLGHLDKCNNFMHFDQ